MSNRTTTLNPTGRTTEAADEALWDLIAGVRDKHPRVPNDAPTNEIIEALTDPANRDDVLRALGAHEETRVHVVSYAARDERVQRRLVTDWEDATDE